MDYVSLFILGVVALYLAMSLRIAGVNERFAVYVLGGFAGLEGPGLALKITGGTAKFARIPLGA